jgi:hypothetical protein
LDNRVNPLFGRINNLELLYKKIDEYTLSNFPFHQPLYTTYGSFQVTWYQPIKLVVGGGTDLKYLIMVVCGFTINLGENVTRYWSDKLDLPIPRTANNNDFEVQQALNSPMSTRQAEYDFEFNPISKFRIGVRCYNTPIGVINTYSFMFIVQYM